MLLLDYFFSIIFLPRIFSSYSFFLIISEKNVQPSKKNYRKNCFVFIFVIHSDILQQH